VFLQGCCEETHGLSDTLLSVLAVRSQEVVDALLRREKRPAAAACAS
jgi:L-ornithine N5-oxygenase